MRIKLGMPLLLSEIASMVGLAQPPDDRMITHISTDTREISSGDLFIPQNGGKAYAEDAINKGAFLLTGDNILLKFAERYAKNLPYILYRIGITGSVGKTTTKEIMKVILKERFRVHANDGNYNNHIGMPMSILSAPPDTEIMIMEMGMNHVGEIKALSNCLHPNIGVITNVGTSHIGNLGSRESIAHAKLEILSGMNHGRLFIPSNEPLLEGYHNATQVSETDLEPIYKIGNIKEDHNRKNLAFTVSIAEFVGMTHDEIQVGISRISTENIRQRLVLRENYHFLVDCYNSSYESVKALIDSAKMRPEYPHRALVLGDILELGEHSKEIHYRVGKLVKPLDFDHLFLFGSSSDFILCGVLENSFERGKIFINYNLTSPNITAGQIKSNCAEGELILMKASRGVRLERILDYF